MGVSRRVVRSMVFFGSVAVVLKTPALAQTQPATPPTPSTASPTTAPASGPLVIDVPLDVVAKQLDEARSGISPRIGGTVYEINRDALESAPQGAEAPLNQVLLQAPGVVQDSLGQLHVRGDHANLQYRINGVLLPEGIAGFGNVLDTRFANKVSLLTGALPAQYGYRTAGVVELETKSGAFDQGGSMSLYGGSRQTIKPSVEYGGASGRLNYYFSGSYLQNNQGLEPPNTSTTPIHNDTEQGKGFAYLQGIVNDTTRISFIGGSSVSKYQLPNRASIDTTKLDAGPYPFTLNGVTINDVPARSINDRQTETNHYGILALQQALGDVDYQVAAFTRYSQTRFQADPTGDLFYNGLAANITRTNVATGIQADGSYKLNAVHTLRSGMIFSRERATTGNLSLTLDANTNDPLTIIDDSAKTGYTTGIYLQDEWRLTDRLTVNYGARFDYVDAYVRSSQLSPRINAAYKMTDATTVHAGYSRYFTPPPLELVSNPSIAKFANTTAALPGTGNTAVRPERSHYFDAGIDHKITPNWQVGLDAYYRIVRDLLDEGQFGQALILSPFNYAKGKVWGTELSTSYTDGPLSLYGNVAYSVSMATQVKSGQFFFDANELDYISTHWVHTDHDQKITASAGVAYTLFDARWALSAIYGSGLRRGFANTDHLPDYTQVNFGVSRPFETSTFGAMTARFDVVNLFDEKYAIRDGTGIGVANAQYGTRRLFFAGLSKQF